jgi:hypothetical protein
MKILTKKYKYLLGYRNPKNKIRGSHMKFKETFTRRLNLNVQPQTYKIIEETGISQGRKAGNMARIILDEWAMNKQNCKKEKGGENMGY